MALRWMVFVDGDFTIRGQKFAETHGVKLPEGDAWRRDVFLWLPAGNRRKQFLRDVIAQTADGMLRTATAPTRAHFYTAVKGDDTVLDDVKDALRRLGFHPDVFKKEGGRSKRVDITLARDFLSHAYLGNYDIAILMTGDGDFVPLMDEVQRRGRIVIVASFVDGMSEQLRRGADYFVDINGMFASAWQEFLGTDTFAAFLSS